MSFWGSSMMATDPTERTRTSQLTESLRSAWPRLTVALILIIALAVAARDPRLRELADQEKLVAWLETLRSHPAAPLVYLGVFVLMTLLGSPTTPLIIAGGLAFGFKLGALLNVTGGLVGAIIIFFAARHLAYDLISRLIGDRYQRVERLIDRQGFWTLVRLRFLPVPFFLCNVGLALAGVRPGAYLLSSVVALTPIITIWTYFAATLVLPEGAGRGDAFRNLAIALSLLIALTFAPTRWIAWQRARRYRQLREERAQRGARSQGDG